MLISTLEALFAGKAELFADLAISKTDFAFDTHPVIKLEFAKDEFASADSLRSCIDHAINLIVAQYNITLEATAYNQRFEELVVKLHQQFGRKVVLLIDEYDKPILNNLKADG